MLLTFGLVALSAGIGAYATQAAGPGKEPAEPGAKDDAPKKNMSSAGELHVVERKQYQVECLLVKVDPWGRDLGADGKGKVLARPTIVVAEGKENVHQAGGQAAITGLGDRPVEFLDFGVSFFVKITGMEDGRLRLDVALEDVALERSELPAAVQVYTRRVRRMAQTNLRDLGDEIKAVLKDDNGNALYWLGVKVVAEETITSRTRWDKKGPR